VIDIHMYNINGRVLLAVFVSRDVQTNCSRVSKWSCRSSSTDNGCTVIGDGGGRSGAVSGRSLDASFWFYLKRSIPKLDQPSKDTIQQKSLGTDRPM